jgi:hypothetical protein
MNRSVAFILTAAVAIAALPALAAGDAATRYILTYSGPESAFQVVHQNQKLAPKNGMTLVAGDCITILQRTHPAQAGDNENRMILLIDGSEVDLGASLTHYCVGKAGAVNPVAQAIAKTVASVMGVFRTAQVDYYGSGLQPAVTRGIGVPPPEIPLLEAGKERIAAGHRSLDLTWSGGAGPYRVEIFRDGTAAPIFVNEKVAARSLHIGALDLIPGSYRLVVKDPATSSAIGGFRVIPASDLPALPADQRGTLATSASSTALGEAVYAAWLMHNGADWSFEAYQHVASQRATSQLAKLLIFELTGDEKT